MIVRRAVVLLFALLLGVQIVRNAAVAQFASLQPALAAKLWAGHPAVESSLGLTLIATASRARTEIPPGAFAMIKDAAIKAPLSPDPFLVRGVQERKGGDVAGARKAFLAAQSRDPRSPAAAYFLADSYLRDGAVAKGLEQTALLARLIGGSTATVAPFIAAYARDPANWPQLRQMFRSQPNMQQAVLVALANDPMSVDALLALADRDDRQPASPWLPIILNKLVEEKDYARARSLWTSIGGGSSDAPVFDTGFSKPLPPLPFNWALSTSGVGLAERQPNGRLHAIFYGNADGVLASQLLVLAPGTYHLSMQLTGNAVHPEAIAWSIRCADSGVQVGSIALNDAASRGWTFKIPGNCGAQWLELVGRSGEVAEQAEVTVGGFTVRRSEHNG